jgi:6-phosphofructokinase
MAAAGVEGLIAIGGEDTLGAASRLHGEHGIKVVGVPKTIDNDLGATDYTFGFDTAINIAMEAIDRLHTTADSHHRVLIVEVMGRHAGWIAFHAGLAGGANAILIPEQKFDVEKVCELVGKRFASQFAPIIVVAEGAEPVDGIPDREEGPLDAFGHVRLGGIGHWLEGEIERRTGKEARATVLGHVQRGGTPTAFDRVLATRFGLHAIDAASPSGKWTLAQVGANARRATEDSTAVAYVGEPDRAARRQSQPILEAAGIAAFGAANGREAVAEVRAALRETDGSDPRKDGLDAVEG